MAATGLFVAASSQAYIPGHVHSMRRHSASDAACDEARGTPSVMAHVDLKSRPSQESGKQSYTACRLPIEDRLGCREYVNTMSMVVSVSPWL